MLALVTAFEHLSNVRQLLNRFHIIYSSSFTRKSDEQSASDSLVLVSEQQHDILLGPVLNRIRLDQRLKYFDHDFREDLEQEEVFARELDACLLEMREIERDLLHLKQRQCHFYEGYLDFIDKKDELIDKFIEYYEEYLTENPEQPLSPATKQLRRQSTIYEFSVPVSNRFDLLKRQQTLNFE